MDARPFESLTPDLMLRALELVGLEPDGTSLPLNSYENRVVRLGIAGGPPVVAKFYRPGRWPDATILEEHAFAHELAAHELPVVAPMELGGRTLHEVGGYRYAVYPQAGGWWPELGSREARERLGRFVGRMHAIGAAADFEHRPMLDPETFGDAPRAFVLEQGFVPPELVAAYESVSAEALDMAAEALEAVDPAGLRIHGDLHRGNLLWTDDGLHVVDLDDCMTGPAVQDLWMFLDPGEEAQGEFADLLRGYREFATLDSRELQLVEALRTLRLVHHTGWIARRWQDPAFPRAFPWFAEHGFWERHVLDLREQISAMREAPTVFYDSL